MIGLDYADFSNGGISTYTVNRLAIDYAREGGLVTISAHVPNPANANGGGLRDKGVHLSDLLDPQTVTHERWVRELDTLAAGLKELEDANVVVLWRPFHEMNGDWFWSTNGILDVQSQQKKIAHMCGADHCARNRPAARRIAPRSVPYWLVCARRSSEFLASKTRTVMKLKIIPAKNHSHGFRLVF
jgi:beta-mannanase